MCESWSVTQREVCGLRMLEDRLQMREYLSLTGSS